MSWGSPILLKIVSENQFSGKTYFHTIASRRKREDGGGISDYDYDASEDWYENRKIVDEVRLISCNQL